MKCTVSQENYLKAIYLLQIQKESVRAVDVSNYMALSKPSVSNALKKLRIPQAMIPSRFLAAGRSLDTIRISIPMSAIRSLSIRLMCRMTTRQVSM